MSYPPTLLPFLSTVSGGPTRPLGAALPRLEQAEAPSPWSPKSTGPSPAELAAARAEACEAGRAEGLRETAALRDRLTALVGSLETAQAQLSARATDLIADAATTVVEAWTGVVSRQELFTPVIGDWMARCQGPSKVNVHPADVETVRLAIGEAPIEITADATLRPGDLKLTGPAFELLHEWQPRLEELRLAIAAAVQETP